MGADSIGRADGGGRRIWFHVMPDVKGDKNRLHVERGA